MRDLVKYPTPKKVLCQTPYRHQNEPDPWSLLVFQDRAEVTFDVFRGILRRYHSTSPLAAPHGYEYATVSEAYLMRRHIGGVFEEKYAATIEFSRCRDRPPERLTHEMTHLYRQVLQYGIPWLHEDYVTHDPIMEDQVPGYPIPDCEFVRVPSHFLTPKIKYRTYRIPREVQQQTTAARHRNHDRHDVDDPFAQDAASAW